MAHPDFYTDGVFNENLISLMDDEIRMGILWDYFVLAYEQYSNIVLDSSKHSLYINNNTDKPVIRLGPSQIVSRNDNTLIRSYPDYMDTWQNFIISKATIYDQNGDEINNLLAEAAVVKLLGDIGVGVPCNITPKVQLDNGWDTNIFVARDVSNENVVILMNRMDCDLQSTNSPNIGDDLYFDIFTPDTTPMQFVVEEQLVRKIERMVQFGITCTDHKPQNVLVISENMMSEANRSIRNYRGIRSEIGVDSDDILNVSKPNIEPYGADFPIFDYNVYIADFDPEHCCRLMSFIHEKYTHDGYTLGLGNSVNNITCGVSGDDTTLYINLSLGMIATVTTNNPLGDAFLSPYVNELYKYIKNIETYYELMNSLPNQIYVSDIIHYFKTFEQTFREEFPTLNKLYGSGRKRSRSSSTQRSFNKRAR